MCQGEGERKNSIRNERLRMSFYWEYAPAFLSTTQLLLILKCCHRDRISALFHFSVHNQNKQAYGCNMADWPYISLFNPHINLLHCRL